MKTKDLKASEIKKLSRIICEKAGIHLKNRLLVQAFTRSSYSSEHGGEDNEILEFIGDQVLSYYVVKIVAKRCGALNSDCEYKIRIRENRFSTLKQELVNNEALAKIIDEWGVMEYLLVGKSDYANNIEKQIKIKADLFEAILGAIAISSNWSSDDLETVVEKTLSIDTKINSIIQTQHSLISFDMENAVNVLKELAEHHEFSPPKYTYRTPDDIGYDENGNPRYTCTCIVENEKTTIIRHVQASSKKATKKAASYLVLCEHYEVQNNYGPNGKDMLWIYKDNTLIPERMTHKK